MKRLLSIISILFFSNIGYAQALLQVNVYQGQHSPVTQSTDRIIATKIPRDSHKLQQLCLLSGHKGFIATNHLVPMTVISSNLLATTVDNSQFKKLRSGIWITPTLSGKDVTINIEILRSRITKTGNNNIDIQRLKTMLVIPLGKWRQIGGSHAQQQTLQNQITYSTYDNNISSNYYYIMIKKTHSCQ